MDSLKVLTLLLVVLVLVPAGVLAWLGFQSTNALDAEVAARVRRELDEAAEALWVRSGVVGLSIDFGMQVGASVAAERLYRELPAGAPREVLLEVQRGLETQVPISVCGRAGTSSAWPPVESVRVLDEAGRSILPRAYEPDDGVSTGDTWRALVRDLRRRAERALYAGDVDDALAVWSEARGRFGTDALRATVDVESALLRLGNGADPADEVRALDDAWPRDVLRRVGRPAVRFWLLAAAQDDTARMRLAEAEADGLLLTTPLTEAERDRARLHAGAPNAQFTGHANVAEALPERAMQPVAVRAAVTSGVTVEVRFHARWAWELFAQEVLADLDLGAVEADVPYVFGLRSSADLLQGIEWRRYVPCPAWEGREVVCVLTHKGVPQLVEDMRDRRRWTVVGVAALMLLVLVGLGLVTRAVRRERAARRLRDDFIANVSHELRTPLTSVCLHAEMLADEDPEPGRRRELAGVVKAEGGRLAALVEDLLDFAALERGTRGIEPAPVDLRAAVEAAVAPYRVLAEREGARLTVDVPPGEALDAWADAHGLSRILANLMSNAWRHGRPSRGGGPGRIRVRAWRQGTEAWVDVRDDGKGIPASERALVFERFARGHASGRVEGTGLGLALGRDLARAMGGDLEIVEDELETVFRLRLAPVPDLGA